MAEVRPLDVDWWPRISFCTTKTGSPAWTTTPCRSCHRDVATPVSRGAWWVPHEPARSADQRLHCSTRWANLRPHDVRLRVPCEARVVSDEMHRDHREGRPQVRMYRREPAQGA